MKLDTFLLDEWLEAHEHSARYNLAASTGPPWSAGELFALMSEPEKDRFFTTPLTYCPGYGHESLRSAIAEMVGAEMEEVLVLSGASEALHALFFLAASPDANAVLPRPCFPPFVDIPQAYGLELRSYELRHDDGFQTDLDVIRELCDENTRLVLVNSPHNPTGAVLSEADWVELGSFCAERGIQLVADEVYHPIYTGSTQRSAAQLTGCTVIGDFSKAFCVPGLRIGYVVEPDARRRHAYWNVRAHFSISNNMPGEFLAEVAVRHRDQIFGRATEVVGHNLALVDQLFLDHADHFEWVRPAGGMTGFPKLRSGASSRPFCEEASSRGVVLVPGDCFGYPPHFRLGFGACSDGFDKAIEILSDVVANTGVVS